MKKKLLFILLATAFVACLLATSALAVNIDGIDYSFKGTEATVTSANQSCTLEIVNIPETVTHEGVTYTVAYIANSAFRNNSVVKEVTTPSTLKDIYEHSFRSMSSLTKVTLNASESFKHFRDAEFWGNTALVSIDMSGCVGLTGIGDGGTYDDTFDGCKNLETVIFPVGITYIGKQTFFNCSKITEFVNLDFTKVTYVGTKAFWGPKISGDVVLSENATYVGNHAFRETNITSIVFRTGENATQTSMDDATFYNCRYLKYAVLPDNIKSIGQYTFFGCSSLEYVVAGNLTSVNSGSAFNGCGALKAIITSASQEDAMAVWSGKYSLTDSSFAPFSEYTHGTLPSAKTVYYGAALCVSCNGIPAGEDFIFENLITEMKIASTCHHCDDEAVTSTFAPVFVVLGYSKSSINGICAVTQGFRINESSLNKYNEMFPEAPICQFGVIASSAANVSGGVAFDENGIALPGVLTADVGKSDSGKLTYKNSYFEIKVSGIDENALLEDGTSYLDAPLCICAYAVVGDTVVYFSASNHCGEAVGDFITYNTIQ